MISYTSGDSYYLLIKFIMLSIVFKSEVMDLKITSSLNRHYIEVNKPTILYAMYELYYPDVFREDTVTYRSITGKPPARVCFCIDTSGSMKEERKLEIAKTAVIKYLDLLDPQDYVAVVTFDKKARVVVPLQQVANKKEIAKKVMELKPGTYTALYDGIRLAYAVVEQVEISQEKSIFEKLFGKTEKIIQPTIPSEYSVKRIILLTDGVPTIGVMDPSYYESLGIQMKKLGISIMALGIGTDYDDKLLAALCTSSGGIWRHILKSEEIHDFFREVVSELKKVVYAKPTLLLNPSSNVNILEAYRIGEAITRISELEKVDGRIEIGLEDIRLGEKQRVVVKIKVEPSKKGRILLLRHTISVEGIEEHGDLYVEATDDVNLYSYETDPTPRLMFLLTEGTKLAEKGLEDRSYAETAYKRIENLLESDEATFLRSDQMMSQLGETILRTTSEILGETLTAEKLKKLREELTILKRREF